MTIAAEDIARIEEIVERIVEEKIKPQPVTFSAHDVELRERMLHVEIELEHQRELMNERFKQMEKRIESLQTQLDKCIYKDKGKSSC